MKNIIRSIVIILCVVTSFYLWMQQTKPNTATNKKTEVPEEQPVKEEEKEEQRHEVKLHRSDGSEETIELETYLEGVVGSEMPSSFELEALKAQAVAARTFVVQRNYEVDDTTSSQVYQDDSQLQKVWAESYDERKQKIKEVVQATKGEVMTYNGAYITASFFSSSPGKTANGNEYWTSDTPYLKSVDSHWDNEVNDGNEQTIEMSVQEFSQALGFQNKIQQISEALYYESGYVKEITIDTITFSGREIREKCKLRSSSFEIQRKQDTIQIKTKGFGHGIGMSQYGAQGMALEGKKYQDILQHYYSGIEIVKL